MTSNRRMAVMASTAALLAGCAADMIVRPPVHALSGADHRRLEGRIVYDGNRDYLPRLLAEGAADARLVFRYGYVVTYGSERTSFAGAMFIPTPILAVPGVMGKDSIGIAGQLEVLDGERIVKVYSATAELKTKSSLFYEGETLTEMRRRGLLAVRDSIDAQLVKDGAALLREVTRP